MEEDKYLWQEYIGAKYQNQYLVDIDLAIEYEKAKQKISDGNVHFPDKFA